jgi:hypothetical protein
MQEQVGKGIGTAARQGEPEEQRPPCCGAPAGPLHHLAPKSVTPDHPWFLFKFFYLRLTRGVYTAGVLVELLEGSSAVCPHGNECMYHGLGERSIN